MRLVWIIAFAVAAIGGGAITMLAIVGAGGYGQVVYYVGLGLGSLVAGWALTSLVPVKSYIEPAIGGFVAVLILVFAGYLNTGAIKWGGGAQPFVVVVAMAFGTAATTPLGAWFAGTPRRSIVATALTAMIVTMGVVMIGAMACILAGASPRGGTLAILMLVLSAVGSAVSQLVVPHQARFICALGMPLVIVVQATAFVIGRKHVTTELLIGGSLMALPGIVGSLIGWRVKPKRADQPDVLAAFD